MGKSNHFGGQPLYGQVIKLPDKSKNSFGTAIVLSFHVYLCSTVLGEVSTGSVFMQRKSLATNRFKQDSNGKKVIYTAMAK